MFDAINQSKSGKITSEEILRFMKANYVRDATLEDASQIIAEFDSNQDGSMNFDEF